MELHARIRAYLRLVGETDLTRYNLQDIVTIGNWYYDDVFAPTPALLDAVAPQYREVVVPTTPQSNIYTTTVSGQEHNTRVTLASARETCITTVSGGGIVVNEAGFYKITVCGAMAPFRPALSVNLGTFKTYYATYEQFDFDAVVFLRGGFNVAVKHPAWSDLNLNITLTLLIMKV